MALERHRQLRISKALQGDIALWKEGVSLERDSGIALEALMRQAAIERWRLARLKLRQGRAALVARPAQYRSAISRFYYTMYHSARAAVYLETGGDDFQEHRKLPSQLPAALLVGVGGNWQNRLKDAREVRNSADYDPIPTDGRYWRARAITLEGEAAELLKATKTFLQAKGCAI